MFYIVYEIFKILHLKSLFYKKGIEIKEIKLEQLIYFN